MRHLFQTLRLSFVLLSLGCPKAPDSSISTDSTAGTASNAGGDATSLPSSSGEFESSRGNSTQDSVSTSLNLVDMGAMDECDPFLQDCPRGMKCSWYEGASANFTRCYPVVPNPKGYKAECDTGGAAFGGQDDCDKGLICFPTSSQREWCIPLCGGSIEATKCSNPPATCTLGNGPYVCIPNCNPLGDECLDDVSFACRPEGSSWFCRELVGAKAVFGGDCADHEDCAKGLVCKETASAAECTGNALGCCTPVCDLNGMNSCPGVGQSCTTWYLPGTAPAGFENVGVCGL